MQKARKTLGSSDDYPHDPERLVVFAAAVLWLLWVGWPTLVTFHLGLSAIVCTIAATALLRVGLVWLRQPPAATDPGSGEQAPPRPPDDMRVHLALGLLLIGVPCALSVTVALRPEALNQQAFTPLSIVVSALCLGGYGAAVLSLGQRRWLVQAGEGRPLSTRPWMPVERPYERIRRRLLVCVVGAGAVAVGLVAPSLGGFLALRRAWGDATLEGGVLTAVLAGSLGTTLAALSLGAALRPSVATDSSIGKRTGRVVSYLALAAIGAVTYWIAMVE